MATKRDYYEILGVAKTATPAELKAAYRKKALEFHPDRNKASDAEEKFKEVNEAYEVLSNEEKRKAYDQFGHAAFDPRYGTGSAGGAQGYRQGPFTYTYYSGGGSNPFGGDYDFSDPFDIFEQFFGGASPFGRREPPKPRYSLRIEFMEAIKGTERTLIHRGKEYRIKIPAGADEGTRIRFEDFDVTVDVKPHDSFKRDGADLFLDHEIPFTLAALGGTTDVQTVQGPVGLKIRPGTQPGTMVRLKGRGAPYLRGSGRGDQYVRLVITVPKDLSREQKKLLQELAKTL